MASSIAALTAGGGGVATTADSSGNLNLISGTTTVLALTATGIAVTGTLSASTPIAVASGGTGVATSTGSGANALATSPTLVTPILGTPTSGNLANCTGIPAPAALSTASGSAPSYSARAWVNFNGTGTVAINASGNVSSITDNGVGDYTVNFTTAMVDANYSTSMLTVGRSSGSATNQSSGLYSTDDVNAVTYTTSAVRISTNKLGSTTGFNDASPVLLSVFR